MHARINGADIYFDVEGSGYVPSGTRMVEKPACFIVHGGPGMDHSVLKPWLSPLADRVQLIYVDLRGNGQSEKTDTATYTIEQMADDLEELRKYLGLGKVAMLGHSFGGMVAQVYAVRHPGSLRRLILCSTTPSYDFMEEVQATLNRVGTPEQKKVIAGINGGGMTQEEYEEGWRTILPLYFYRKDPGIQRAMDEIMGRMRAQVGVASYMFGNVLPDYDVRKRLAGVKVETLIVSGRHDWVTPVSQPLAIQELLPNSRMVLYEDSGHLPFVEEQEAFNQEVGDFIATAR